MDQPRLNEVVDRKLPMMNTRLRRIRRNDFQIVSFSERTSAFPGSSPGMYAADKRPNAGLPFQPIDAMIES